MTNLKTNRRQDVSTRPPKPKGVRNVLKQAIETWFHEQDKAICAQQGITLGALLDQTPATYTVYEPMMLLPNHAFQADIWTRCFQMSPDSQKELWKAIVKAGKVTHLAMNSPIPTPHFSNEPAESSPTKSDEESINVIRRPSDLLPLWGNFGSMKQNFDPTGADLDAALWVSARQNGIAQTWAPVHTMFSRGNIKEKARLLTLPSLKDQSEPCTAVDLYAGIGYFAFSYAKTGVAKVLCFEISAWSVEGLRRGAKMNGWNSVTFEPEDLASLSADDPRLTDPGVKFLIFQMDNVFANEVIDKIRHVLPPVRHVNCGLLPSSKMSWRTAVHCLDWEQGGCIHIHENLRVAELDEISQKIREEVHTLVTDEWKNDEGHPDSDDGKQVTLDHVEKVKSYSPGVMHVVLDLTVKWKKIS